MKRLLFLITVMLLGFARTGYAQSGFSYFGIRSGYTIEKGYTATMFYNMPSNYDSSFELAGQFFDMKPRIRKTDYRNILGSLVYKSQMSRSVNTSLNFVIGGAAGTDFHKFIVGPQVGFEVDQYLGGIDLVFSNRNEYIFLTDKDRRLRFNFEFGIRIPLN